MMDRVARLAQLRAQLLPLGPNCGGMAIAPMRVGSGQLFKVMEAMACGAPLIATRLATAGTEAESERHFLAAETPEAFARRALRLMREPALASRIAEEARRLLERSYGWEQSSSESTAR
jgi:polysaccharide biosynthesis protein PslH